MRDFIRQKGAAGFGTRLRRLSERLDHQVETLYRARGVAFEPRWYPLVAALGEGGQCSVGELATLLGISHAAVSQVRGELLDASLIHARTDRADKRRQLLALSPKGRRLAEKLAPLWRDIAAATDELLSLNAPHLLAELDRLDAALAGMAMVERVAPPAAQSPKTRSRSKHA